MAARKYESVVAIRFSATGTWPPVPNAKKMSDDPNCIAAVMRSIGSHGDETVSLLSC
jgi:hypothetical protein